MRPVLKKGGDELLARLRFLLTAVNLALCTGKLPIVKLSRY